MERNVLIVEDELKLAKILKEYLYMAGFDSTCLTDGSSIAEWVRKNTPDLILLDLMLPNLDGIEICKEIRSFSDVPIIMISARTDCVDRLLGLYLGADDYICKPFSPREVVARVQVVLRRIRNKPAEQSTGLVLDELRYQATLGTHRLNLTALEFKMLQLLSSKPGYIYSRQQLMDQIYPDRRRVNARTIDSHINKLRKKIAEANSNVDYIFSSYGAGYKFEEA